jgi:tryptophan synthase beta chain
VRLYLKREDLAHTGAHKINNALGQPCSPRRLGKSRVIAETGAGQHGVATATACALLDLPCVVYMGVEDIERQGPNVLRMRALGAEVRSVTSGTAHAQGRGQRGDARLGDERRDDPLRARLGDGAASVSDDRSRPPAPDRRRGGRAADRVEGRLPDLAIACVGGGSNCDRAARPVHREPTVRLAVVEAAGRRHRDRAARGGDPGRDAGHPPRLAIR